MILDISHSLCYMYLSIVIEPRIASHTPRIEPKHVTSPPLKPPPPPPGSPEDPEPQPDLGPRERSPIADKRFLLYSSKYDNMSDQTQAPLDRKVLEIFKKLKTSNKSLSHLGKLSTAADGEPNLNRGPGFRAPLSAIQTQTRTIPSLRQFDRTIIKEQKSMPEWRKSLYKHISLQGFCSPRAARLAVTEHLVDSSTARQLASTIPSLQPDQAATHQRVVQKIQMNDTPEPTSFHFHHVIPMNSQHSFFTLNPCGKTQYGRLQFDWMRGSEEDKQLKVCA